MASSGGDISYSNAVETSRIILLTLVSIFMIFTILANSAYILTLWKKTALHKPSNMLLGALAMSDVLVAVVAEPIWMVAIFYTLLSAKDSKTHHKSQQFTFSYYFHFSILSQ